MNDTEKIKFKDLSKEKKRELYHQYMSRKIILLKTNCLDTFENFLSTENIKKIRP